MPQEMSSWLVQLSSLRGVLEVVAIIFVVTMWAAMLAVFLGPLLPWIQERRKVRKQPFLERAWPSCDCLGYPKDMQWCWETLYGEQLFACPQCPTQLHRGSRGSVISRFPLLEGRDDGLTLHSGRVIKPFAQQPEGLLVRTTAGVYLVQWDEIGPKHFPEVEDLVAWVSSGIKEPA